MMSESKNVQRIKRGICPYCGRFLKPRLKDSHEQKNKDLTLRKLAGKIVLCCKHCEVEIYPEDIRKDQVPANFDERHLAKEKKRREKRREEAKKHEHGPTPNHCPECEGTEVEEYPGDHLWECLNCDHVFEWRYWRVMFSGSIEVLASSEEEAVEIGYDSGEYTCEADRIWE